MYQAWCATHSDGINVWGKKKADEWAAQLDADYHESETK
jgi:hypothetical protein